MLPVDNICCCCFKFVLLKLICNAVLIFAIQQSDSNTYTYILFHCGLAQDVKYSSLCYTLGSCHLSMVFVFKEF